MKIRKGYTSKTGLHYTVNIDIAEAFNKAADAKCINKSKLIESFLKQWTKDNS